MERNRRVVTESLPWSAKGDSTVPIIYLLRKGKTKNEDYDIRNQGGNGNRLDVRRKMRDCHVPLLRWHNKGGDQKMRLILGMTILGILLFYIKLNF